MGIIAPAFIRTLALTAKATTGRDTTCMGSIAKKRRTAAILRTSNSKIILGDDEGQLDDEWEQPPPMQNAWHQRHMQAVGEIDWIAWREGALEEHEAAQMELDMIRGHFSGNDDGAVVDDNGDAQPADDAAQSGGNADGAESEEPTDTEEANQDRAHDGGDAGLDDGDDQDLELQRQVLASLALGPYAQNNNREAAGDRPASGESE